MLISLPCLFNWLLLVGYRQTPSISAGFLPPKIWTAISMFWFFLFLMSITWCFKAYHNSVSHEDTLSILHFQWAFKKLPAAFISLQKGSFFPPYTVNDSNTGIMKSFPSCLGVYCPWHLLDKQKDISVLAHGNVTTNFTLEQAINESFYLHFFFHQLKEVIEKVYPLVKMARAGQVPKEVQY